MNSTLSASDDTWGIANAAEPGRALPIRKSLSERAYDYLFHKIISGEIAQGQILPSENELASLLNVSRPVLREALGRLREDGLVETRRGKGSVVRSNTANRKDGPSSSDNIRNLLNSMEFRMVVEPPVAAMAAERRDNHEMVEMKSLLDQFADLVINKKMLGFQLDFKFHLCIARASRNPLFAQVATLSSHEIEHSVLLARHLSNLKHVELSRIVYAEHLRVFDAISSQDPVAARKALFEHLDRGRKRMLQELETP